MHAVSQMPTAIAGYGSPQPERPSLGVVPVIWAIGGGAAAAGAGGSYWIGSDCQEWWCWQNIKGAVLGTPAPSIPDLTVPPVAPVTQEELTTSGAFTPEEMIERTAQRQRDVLYTAGQLGPLATGVPGGAASTSGAPDPSMNLLGLVLVGAGVLMLVKG